MNGSDPTNVALAGAFESERARLMAVAYRMLGSRADAEDAVQESWVRLARRDAGSIDNLAAWLTTVVGRVCIDLLRSRGVRAETAYDEHIPEFVVTDYDDDSPEENALLGESVSLALLVVLEALKPNERLAFVLHDMFAVPFDEIGQIIGKSGDATKMLASRARRKVRDTPRPTEERGGQRAVVAAFLAASRAGDFEGLLQALDPEVTWRNYTARGLTVVNSATAVATQARNGAGAHIVAREVLVNGEPGLLARTPHGRPLAVMACTVVDGRIVEIVSVSDPKRLAAMDLPGDDR
jgi:RNA polymerase sigma factor (sigma-70 family)